MNEPDRDAVEAAEAATGMKQALAQSALIAAIFALVAVYAVLLNWRHNEVAYRGPGDLVAGATAFYGVRGYDADFVRPGTNRAIKLRRAADNATLDIAILRSGALDMATAAAFCANTQCYVAEWYDQTGHGYNLVQKTLSEQPVFNFEGYGASAAVQFDAGAATYLAGAFPWVRGDAAWSAQAALLAVAPTNAVEPVFNYGAAGANAPGQCLSGDVRDNIRFQFITDICGMEVLSNIETSAPMALNFDAGGPELGGNADGKSWTAPFSGAEITGTGFTVGGAPARNNGWFSGGLGEIILFPRALSKGEVQELIADERIFYGF